MAKVERTALNEPEEVGEQPVSQESIRRTQNWVWHIVMWWEGSEAVYTPAERTQAT